VKQALENAFLFLQFMRAKRRGPRCVTSELELEKNRSEVVDVTRARRSRKRAVMLPNPDLSGTGPAPFQKQTKTPERTRIPRSANKSVIYEDQMHCIVYKKKRRGELFLFRFPVRRRFNSSSELEPVVLSAADRTVWLATRHWRTV
jgi:hypothetical protein